MTSTSTSASASASASTPALLVSPSSDGSLFVSTRKGQVKNDGCLIAFKHDLFDIRPQHPATLVNYNSLASPDAPIVLDPASSSLSASTVTMETSLGVDAANPLATPNPLIVTPSTPLLSLPGVLTSEQRYLKDNIGLIVTLFPRKGALRRRELANTAMKLQDKMAPKSRRSSATQITSESSTLAYEIPRSSSTPSLMEVEEGNSTTSMLASSTSYSAVHKAPSIFTSNHGSIECNPSLSHNSGVISTSKSKSRSVKATNDFFSNRLSPAYSNSGSSTTSSTSTKTRSRSGKRVQVCRSKKRHMVLVSLTPLVDGSVEFTCAINSHYKKQSSPLSQTPKDVSLSFTSSLMSKCTPSSSLKPITLARSSSADVATSSPVGCMKKSSLGQIS